VTLVDEPSGLHAEPEEHALLVPESSSLRVARAMSDNAIVAGAFRRGLAPDAFRSRLTEAMSKRLSSVLPWVRTTPASLGRVLADDRFKTQHEVAHSRGAYSPLSRSNYEHGWFGYHPTDTPHEQRPVYGYLTEHPDGRVEDDLSPDHVRQYGSVAVRLKRDEMAPRTTWVAGDSLVNAMTAHPSPLLKPELHSLSWRDLVISGSYRGHPPPPSELSHMLPGERGYYLEAQYHGGVRPEHVEEVVFHTPAPHRELKAELDRRGIPHRVAERDDSEDGRQSQDEAGDERHWTKALGRDNDTDSALERHGPVAAAIAASSPRGLSTDPLSSNEIRLSHRAKAAAARKGVTPADYRARMQRQVEAVVPAMNPWVRTTAGSLDGILRTGRFKTQHEIPTSNGVYDPHERSAYERLAWGYGNGTSPKHRPVYGYLTDDPDGHSHGPHPLNLERTHDYVGMYGHVAVRLHKDLVAPRTTWVAGDSYDDNADHFDSMGKKPRWISKGAQSTPSLFLAPHHSSIPALTLKLGHRGKIPEYDPDDHSRRGLSWGYSEAQYHGGLRVSDVAEVVFHRKMDRDWLAPALDAASIPHRVAGTKPGEATVKSLGQGRGDEPFLERHGPVAHRLITGTWDMGPVPGDEARAEAYRLQAPHHETTPGELRQRVQSQVDRVVPTLQPWVKTTPGSLGKILDDGWWKTQHELGKSSAHYDPHLRDQLEAAAFGYAPGHQTSHRYRPVYGYLTERDHGDVPSGYTGLSDMVNPYGNVAVRLRRDRVAPRTTLTFGDTLDRMSRHLRRDGTWDSHEHGRPGGPDLMPSPLLSPSERSVSHEHLVNWDINATTSHLMPGGYVEAQYHGGLTPEDVAEVVAHGKPLPAPLRKRLEAAGIPHRVVGEAAELGPVRVRSLADPFLERHGPVAHAVASGLWSPTAYPGADNSRLQDEEISARAKRERVRPEHIADAMRTQVRTVLPALRPWVRITPRSLSRVIDSGRFKTQHEVKSHPDIYNPPYRKRYEARAFGYDEASTDPRHRPVYGYLTDDPHGTARMRDRQFLSIKHIPYVDVMHDPLTQYGRIAVRLKDGVLNRSTWTAGDSLNHNGGLLGEPGKALSTPSPILTPSHRSISAPVLNPKNMSKSHHALLRYDPFLHTREGLTPLADDYIEAQYHGGLSVGDIHEIVFHRKADREDIAPKLDAAGIPHRYSPQKVEIPLDKAKYAEAFLGKYS
jgi:hypothetical protein